jgi:hypothetical protein
VIPRRREKEKDKSWLLLVGCAGSDEGTSEWMPTWAGNLEDLWG